VDPDPDPSDPYVCRPPGSISVIIFLVPHHSINKQIK
jgi:hypothetical protein